MICPDCGATLQRMSGAECYRVDRCLGDRGSVVEVKRIHVIYACQRCEFIETGNAEAKK